MMAPTMATRGDFARGMLLAAVAALATAACAADPAVSPSGVPEALAPSSHAALALVARGRGVQVYECRQSPERAGAWAWRLVAPDAELFDARGEKVGRHFSGPAWEARDGSRIVGTVLARSDAPAVDAVPWLLLTAKSVGPDGEFSRVTQIQRLNTSGGVAPPTGCTADTAGAMLRVPYAADYYFWRAGAGYAAY